MKTINDIEITDKSIVLGVFNTATYKRLNGKIVGYGEFFDSISEVRNSSILGIMETVEVACY